MPRIIKSIYTCPKCGHSVGWRRRWIYSGNLWPCKKCGTFLGIGVVRTFILLFAIWVSTHLWVKPQVNFWVFIVILAFGFLLAFNVAPIVKKKVRPKSDAE